MRHRLRTERLIQQVAEAPVPTRARRRSPARRGGRSSTASITSRSCAATSDRRAACSSRVHSECLTGDVFGSRRCDCGSQLDDALAAIAAEGRGVVVYLRGHEGRGIGIAAKLGAYRAAGRRPRHGRRQPAPRPAGRLREYGTAAQILLELGVQRLRLITNNPAKCEDLDAFGIEVAERVALPARPTPENITYLETKRRRMGHLLAGLETSAADRLRHEPRGRA